MTRLVPALAVVAFALAAVPPALAQPGRHGGGRGGPPPFVDRMYPPGLVMRHQDEIGLTAAQRDGIKKAMADTEHQLVDLRWTLEAEMEKLTKLLDADTVDEQAALAQTDRVMEAEQRLKKAHLTLLIRIKNMLTPPQREKLQTLRTRDPGPPGPPPD
jgi:Spy/CpxP family protein refolding chaperone